MNIILKFTICLLMAAPLYLSAQDKREDTVYLKEDVVYLKDGHVYRGTMLDQVYGVSYKLQVSADSILVFPAEKVAKITKEAGKVPAEFVYRWDEGKGRDGRWRPGRYRRYSTGIYDGYKDKGYFFQMQCPLDYAASSIRMIHGYKFNEFAAIGIGIGMGGLLASANTATVAGIYPYGGQYYPLFLYYSGDIFQENFTAFYDLEIGYAWVSNIMSDGDGYYFPVSQLIQGGVMGGAGFGFRIYKGRMFTFSLSANLDIQYAGAYTYSAGGGSAPPTSTYTFATLFMPGIKIGVGLTR